MGSARQIIVGLTAALLFASCQRQSAGPGAQTAANAERPELSMEQLKISSFANEGLDWEMVSPSAEAYTRKKRMVADDIKVAVYRQGKKSSDITADRGILNTNNPAQPVAGSSVPVRDEYGLAPGDLYLDGNVVAVSTDGTRLMTDWLRYRKSIGLIESTAPVRVVREDSITTGIGLEAQSDLSSVKIFQQTLVVKERRKKK